MDRLPARGGRGEARYLEGGSAARPGGFPYAAQLPHAALLGEEHLGPRTAAAAEYLELGRCVPVHRQPDPLIEGPDDRARQARRIRAPRSAALPDAARLVEGLHLDLCPSTEGRPRRRLELLCRNNREELRIHAAAMLRAHERHL